MKHKRVYMGKSSYVVIFYRCPNCGSEILDDSKTYFKEPLEEKGMAAFGMKVSDIVVLDNKPGQVCPVCGSPVEYDNEGSFLDISDTKKSWDAFGRTEGPKGEGRMVDYRTGLFNYDYARSFDYYFDEATSDFKLYHYSELNEFSDEKRNRLKMIYPLEAKTDDNDISTIFGYMQRVRMKEQEASVINTLDGVVADSEAQPIDSPEADASAIKKDPEVLKQYIEHLINIESSIISTKQRLEDLLKLQIPIDEEVSVAGFVAVETKRDDLENAKEAYQHLPSKESFSSTQPKVPEAPKEPKEPVKPELKKAGLFNKRKIQEENEALTKAYEKKKEEFDSQQKAYGAALEEYKRALKAYDKEYSAWEKETEEKIEAAEEAAAKKVEEAEKALAIALKNPPETVEIQEKNMLTAEIEQAKETLGKLVKAKNELYSINVIFGKYRDIVALTSFYEYLLAGRCEALEGKDGAYNIYESEIRANQIISQLNDVMDSLEQIKNGQYMVYSTMKGVYSSLEQLNSKTEDALSAMEKMQGDISQISKQSEVIAYNTEQAAFYAKKNKELTDALGFMVALK